MTGAAAKAAAKAAEALKASEKTLTDKVAGLEAELKKSQPDAIKTVYEARLAEMKSQLDAKDKSLADATAEIGKYACDMKAENDKTLAALDKAALERECETEFTKALEGKNVNTGALAAIKQLVLGDGYSKFGRR